jgi:NAD(P)-dependent dehydrogenase (short-subunit alcohol dehydrogenase family)
MQQRWLITGSSRGLGRALSEAVLEAGHRLVATARDSARLSDLVGRFGDAVRTAALDVADPSQRRPPSEPPSTTSVVSMLSVGKRRGESDRTADR